MGSSALVTLNLYGYAGGAKRIQGLGIVLGSMVVIALYPIRRKGIQSDTTGEDLHGTGVNLERYKMCRAI